MNPPETLARYGLAPSTPKSNGRRRFQPRRDVHSRRHWRERVRRVIRVIVLLVFDLAAAGAALALAGLLMGGRAATEWRTMLPLVFVLAAGVQGLLGTYGANLARRSYLRSFTAGMLSAALVGGLGLVYPVFQLPVAELALFGVLAGSGFAAGRLAIDLAIQWIYRQGVGRRATLFIGDMEDVWSLVSRLQRSRERRTRVVGHLSPDPATDPTALGGIDDLPDVIEAHDVRNVIISAHLEPDSLEVVLYECFARGVPVSVVPRTLSDLPCRVSGQDVMGWPLVELEVPRLHLLQVVVKRTVDVVTSFVGLLLVSPLFALIAAVIKIESRGPVFFRQKRLGLGGRSFTIFKFRTMREDAETILRSDRELYEEYLRCDFKLPPDRDPRITRVGAFLRRTSLDEIPQLLNVLKGDMSLVGPRPIVPAEIENYGESAPMFLGVKPGVTGHWQVNGRSHVAYPERAELDLEYIKGWSLGQDLRILLRTVPAVLRKDGAH